MGNSILDKVNGPKDLKTLSYAELDTLAEEIREVIIRVVSKNGGHMASNLGVVEMTLALHRILDSPNDKIVWDTSNQCYTHKLVTGARTDLRTSGRRADTPGLRRSMKARTTSSGRGMRGRGSRRRRGWLRR